MFISVRLDNREVVIDDLNHVLNLRKTEKLLSHSHDEIGSVLPIFNNTNRFGNFVLSHSFMADSSSLLFFFANDNFVCFRFFAAFCSIFRFFFSCWHIVFTELFRNLYVIHILFSTSTRINSQTFKTNYRIKFIKKVLNKLVKLHHLINFYK